MTEDQYVLWFILMAVGIGLLLGLGTLRMAGVLKRPEHAETPSAEIHHWYDRFHLHHGHHGHHAA